MFHGQRRRGDGFGCRLGCRCTRGNGNAPGSLTLRTTDAVFLVCALPTHFARTTRSATVHIRFVSVVLAVHARGRGRRPCSRHERRAGRSWRWRWRWARPSDHTPSEHLTQGWRGCGCVGRIRFSRMERGICGGRKCERFRRRFCRIICGRGGGALRRALCWTLCWTY
jgi:hypothetical protein